MMNNMRNFVLAIMFASVLVMSCDKHGQEMEGQPIRFDVVETKSLATKDDIKSNNSRMTVRGVYEGSSSDLIILFDDQTVTSTGSGWTYSPTRYWIPGQTIRFASVWPGNLGLSLDGDLETKIKMSTFTQAANYSEQKDLLFANPVSASSGSVAFDFRHLLSNIRFELDMNAPGKSITVTDISLEDVRNVGTLTMESPDGSSWTDSWDLTSSMVDLSSGSVSEGLEQSGGSFKTIPEDGFIVIPQKVNESSSTTRLVVSVMIENNTTHERERKAIPATLPQYGQHGGEWLAGKRIIYRITIDENTNIIFGKPEVTSWGSTQTSGAIVIK